MDLLDDQNYLHYYNTSTSDHHYMHSSSDHMHLISQHNGENAATSQNSLHFMPAKSSTINEKISSRQSTINHSIDPYTLSLDSPMSPMMNSPPGMMVVPINAPLSNHQSSRFQGIKSTSSSVPISSHYETTLIGSHSPYQTMSQSASHHQSTSPASCVDPMNHFNNENVMNVSNTLTHISETDNSSLNNNQYAPTPPLSQQQPLSIVTDNNHQNINTMISNPKNFNSMTCHISSNNWHNNSAVQNQSLSSVSSNISKLKNLVNSDHLQQQPQQQINNLYNSVNSDQNRHQSFSYLKQQPQNSESYHSISSTPVSNSKNSKQLPTSVIEKNIINKNHQRNQYSEKITEFINGDKDHLISKKTTSSQNIVKKELNNNSVEKRSIIIFKVIEQWIDPSTQNVLKEIVTKNEKIIIPSLEKIHQSQSTINISNITSTSSSAINSPVTSSDFLADVSESATSQSFCNNLLVDNRAENKNSVFTQKTNKKDEKLKKVNEIKNTKKMKSSIINAITCDSDNKIDDEKEDQEKAASALLSLQTANNSANISSADPSLVENTDDNCKDKSSSSSLMMVDETTSESSEIFGFVYEKLKPGIKVMAKWSDKNFYSAEVKKQFETHKWTVEFEDAATRNLFESEIIRVENLLPKQDVMLQVSDDLCVKATIEKVINENKNIKLNLKHFDNDKRVTRSYFLRDIFLNVEQSSSILNKISKNNTAAVYADVDLDNIVAGKRSRSNKSSSMNEKKDSSKSVSNNKKSNYQCSSQETISGCYKKKPKLDLTSGFSQLEEINEKTSESNNFYNSSPSKNYKKSSFIDSSQKIKSLNSSKIPKNEVEKILGPTLKSGSKLFQNFNFLLTWGYHNKNSITFSAVSPNESNNPEHSIPFDKNYLIKQIKSGGGKVFDSFQEMKSFSSDSECICITDTYSRSIKFLQCLAAGISIISHLWIIECCRKNKLIDRNSYLLPAGYSIVTSSLSSERNTFKRSSVLFKGVKFYFGSQFPDKLYQTWSQVLFAAQAIIVDQVPDIYQTLQRRQLDIIIGDNTCPEDLVQKAKQLKIPVVSSEYIIQCLINGRRLQPDQSPQFSHLFHKY